MHVSLDKGSLVIYWYLVSVVHPDVSRATTGVTKGARYAFQTEQQCTAAIKMHAKSPGRRRGSPLWASRILG